MVYWHVEKKATCIYSQLRRCSSSEVAAMIQGVLRHCTQMSVDRHYVDTHGQTQVAFAFTRLLGFRLQPRLKDLHRKKLSVPEGGMRKQWPHLAHVLTRPIRWSRVRQQYDEMVKHVTALRLGTASAEAILRRFTRENVKHPTYMAFSELGKALRTIFLCDYLRSEELRREVHQGLNVMESWNAANDFVFYGKGSELATNRNEAQEMSFLALQLLQNALVYINTLMLQSVIEQGDWTERLSVRDRDALTPLIYEHINPYGRFELNFEQRLAI